MAVRTVDGTKRSDAAELLTRAEAADYLGIAKQTLAIWKTTGRYALPVVKVGRLTKYRRSDLDEFLSRRTLDTSAKHMFSTKSVDTPQAHAFAEVKIVEPGPPPSPATEEGFLDVILPSGIKLRLSQNCPQTLLSTVMNVLERH